MERPPNLKPTKASICISIIVIFHVVGLIGFLIPGLQPLFLKLVPYHLLLMLGVIVYSHQQVDIKFITFILVMMLAGYAIEWIGVHRHLLFGDYAYGETLGLKWSDIPLMISVNWFLLVYATGNLVRQLKISNTVLRIIAGALLMVLLDVAIEPVAVRFDYWHWAIKAGFFTAPAKNYIDWFLCSAFMLSIFELFGFKHLNKVGTVLYITQLVFFIALAL